MLPQTTQYSEDLLVWRQKPNQLHLRVQSWGNQQGGGAAKGRMNTESGVWKAAASGALSDTSLYLSRAF